MIGLPGVPPPSTALGPAVALWLVRMRLAPAVRQKLAQQPHDSNSRSDRAARLPCEVRALDKLLPLGLKS